MDVVGFCFLDLASSYEPPESLVNWLKAGDKPIYIGFGSLVSISYYSFHLIWYFSLLKFIFFLHQKLPFYWGSRHKRVGRFLFYFIWLWNETSITNQLYKLQCDVPANSVNIVVTIVNRLILWCPPLGRSFISFLVKYSILHHHFAYSAFIFLTYHCLKILVNWS